jgi:serine/threonine protein kinase
MEMEHPKVVRIFRYFRLAKDAKHWFLCLEEELLTCDLDREIGERSKTRNSWSDEEMKAFVLDMVEVLATAQALGIAHRDIKPANVFLTGSTFKLGDFGWSRRIRYEENLYVSLSGTASFLSPNLRHAMLQCEQRVRHNPYKSDVFSLGLTLLCMVLLQKSVNRREDQILSTLADAHCAEWLRALLFLMLQPEEPHRPDFIMLSDLLRAASSRGVACSHLPCTHRFQACQFCLDSAHLVTMCSLCSKGQICGTPTGMATCSACGGLAVEGDLVPMDAPLGVFCHSCLQIKLDEAEIAESCRGSVFSLVYYSLLNAL